MIKKFAGHATLANLLMLILIAVGIISLPQLRRETFPDFTKSKLKIQVVYPGASAIEVEESVCQLIEDAIDGVKQVKEITSESREGVGFVTVELEEGADIAVVQNDVETEIDAIDDFPIDAEDPVLEQLGLTDSVMVLAVSGPMSTGDLKDYCEDLKTRLKRQPLISLVDIKGFSDRQFRVDLDNESLRKFGLSANDVSVAISRQSIDLPVGTIETTHSDLLIRFVEQRRDPRELEDIVIAAARGGAEVRLSDLGHVVDVFEQAEVQSLYGADRAGILVINKTKSQDTTRVANNVRAFIEAEKIRQPHLNLVITQDNSDLINQRIRLVVKNALQGVVMVFFVLWTFFNIRISFWVVVSLPVSFFGAFFIMLMLGQTINMISLVSMLLATGLLMDDGIVIAENVARHLAMGKKAMSAAVDGVGEVSSGVISSFLTTICVLGPLASLSGDMGKILEVIPIVLIAVMAVSLVEAFFILPAHLGHSLDGVDVENQHPIRTKIDGVVDWVREKVFGKIIDFAVSWRYLAVGTALGVFLFSVGLVSSGIVPSVGFPDTEGDVLEARILMPQGTPLVKTRRVVDELSRALNVVNDRLTPDQPVGESLVKHVVTEFDKNADAYESGAHVATIAVSLLGVESRTVTIDELIELWRAETNDLTDVMSLIFGEPGFGPAGRPIEIRFIGDDLNQLKAAAGAGFDYFSQFEGVGSLTDDLRQGKQELKIRLKKGSVGLGFDVQTMASQVRAAFQGSEADQIQIGPEQYEIQVRLDPSDRNSVADFSNFHFIAQDGTQVPLLSVADVEMSKGWSRVARVDGQRAVTLIGDVDSRVANTVKIINQFKKEKLDSIEQDFPGVKVAIEGADAESKQTQSSMMVAMSIGMLGVFVILSYQFESWIEPLIVMTAIPMALIGVIWGHLIMGVEISMPSIVGFISLSGVVVNDSILLIMFLKQSRESGEGAADAARLASRLRFRAIMLTSATTVAGLIPLMLETSSQAQTLVPLAISIGFGMMSATVLVLIVVPTIYVILDDLGLVRKKAGEH